LNRLQNDPFAAAAVICAAGTSSRMGGIKKEYRPLPGSAGGLTVLGAAVSVFAAVPEITTIVIAVPANPETGEAAAKNALSQEIFEEKTGPAIYFIPGGATRSVSVFNALVSLAARPVTPGYVLIHDGARPWVSVALVRRVIEAVKTHQAVIPLMPLTETPKETDTPLDNQNTGTVFIKQHLKRAAVGTAQTPQAFAFPEILAAYEKAAEQIGKLHLYTDDAEIWASCYGAVAAIPGEPENRKITFAEDLAC
jgi:2-C-methyl-D-erythritol 4-phosphate cytidylyltransferase